MSFWLVVALAATTATACPPGGDALKASTKPEWLQKPSIEQIAWAYPPDAIAKSISGQATVNCKITVSGLLDTCHVVTETPTGFGFGEAAIQLRQYIRLAPATLCGVKIETSFNIPFVFNVPEELTVPAGPPPTPEAAALSRRLLALGDFEWRLRYEVETNLLDRFYSKAGDTKPTLDDRQTIHEISVAAWDWAHEEVLNTAADSYARLFTVDELKTMLAFFETPTGQKFIDQQAYMIVIFGSARTAMRTRTQTRFDELYCQRLGVCAEQNKPNDAH